MAYQPSNQGSQQYPGADNPMPAYSQSAGPPGQPVPANAYPPMSMGQQPQAYPGAPPAYPISHQPGAAANYQPAPGAYSAPNAPPPPAYQAQYPQSAPQQAYPGTDPYQDNAPPPQRTGSELKRRLTALGPCGTMVTERNDRKNFIKKVYAILSCQLLFTVIITCIPFASEGVRDWMQENFWLGYVCWFLTIILLIVIFCFKNVAKTYPKNMILLGLFTVLEAYIVAFICTFYEPFSVFMAAVSTCAITIGLTVYAWTTRRDFTTMGGCVIGFAIAAIFFAIIIGTNPGAYVSAILILIIILIYCFFIVYDTQLIAGGRYAQLNYDDYVIGALLLYVDIVVLFLYILMLLGKKN